jgi:hypothetical protein
MASSWTNRRKNWISRSSLATPFFQVHYDDYSNAGSEKELSDGGSSSASFGEDR